MKYRATCILTEESVGKLMTLMQNIPHEALGFEALQGTQKPAKPQKAVKLRKLAKSVKLKAARRIKPKRRMSPSSAVTKLTRKPGLSKWLAAFVAKADGPIHGDAIIKGMTTAHYSPNSFNSAMARLILTKEVIRVQPGIYTAPKQKEAA